MSEPVIMFTEDGTEVQLVKKLEEGYLGNPLYAFYEDDEEEEVYYGVTKNTLFFETLLTSPPEEKYAASILELLKQENQLKDEISNLQAAKRSESSLLNKISKFPILQQLADALTGNYKYVLFINNLQCKSKSEYYLSSNLRTANIKNKGYGIYDMYNDNYIGSDDKHIMIFNSKEELNKKSLEIAIERINFDPKHYRAEAHLQNIFDKINSDSIVKKDEKFLALYESKMKEYKIIQSDQKAKELQEKKEKLEKEIELLTKS